MFKKTNMSDDLKKCIKTGFIAIGLLMFVAVLGLTIILDFIVNLGGSFPIILILLKSVIFGFSLWKAIHFYKLHKQLLNDNLDELKSLKNG